MVRLGESRGVSVHVADGRAFVKGAASCIVPVVDLDERYEAEALRNVVVVATA